MSNQRRRHFLVKFPTVRFRNHVCKFICCCLLNFLLKISLHRKIMFHSFVYLFFQNNKYKCIFVFGFFALHFSSGMWPNPKLEPDPFTPFPQHLPTDAQALAGVCGQFY